MKVSYSIEPYTGRSYPVLMIRLPGWIWRLMVWWKWKDVAANRPRI